MKLRQIDVPNGTVKCACGNAYGPGGDVKAIPMYDQNTGKATGSRYWECGNCHNILGWIARRK